MLEYPEHKVDDMTLIAKCDMCGQKHNDSECPMPSGIETDKRLVDRSDSSSEVESKPSEVSRGEPDLSSSVGTSSASVNNAQSVSSRIAPTGQSLDAESPPRRRKRGIDVEFSPKQLACCGAIVLSIVAFVSANVIASKNVKPVFGQWQNDAWVFPPPKNESVEALLANLEQAEQLISRGGDGLPRSGAPGSVFQTSWNLNEHVIRSFERVREKTEAKLESMGPAITPKLLAYMKQVQDRPRMRRMLRTVIGTFDVPETAKQTLQALRADETQTGDLIEILKDIRRSAIPQISQLILSDNDSDRTFGLRTLCRVFQNGSTSYIDPPKKRNEFGQGKDEFIVWSPRMQTLLTELATSREAVRSLYHNPSSWELDQSQFSSMKALALLSPANNQIADTLEGLTSDQHENSMKAQAAESLGALVWNDRMHSSQQVRSKSGNLTSAQIAHIVEVLRNLRSAEKSGYPSVAEATRKALCQIAFWCPEYRPDVEEAAHNGDQSAMEAALFAAQTMGEKEYQKVIDVIIDRTRSSDPKKRNDCVQALLVLEKLPAHYRNQVIPAIIDRIEFGTSQNLGGLASEQLGRLGKDAVSPYRDRLKRIAAQSNDAVAARWATRALSITHLN